MQNTTNLNLKKPDYTDFADIQDINDNMDALDAAIHDTQNSVATFTSSDVADGSATSWMTVTKLSSGETHKSIFAKISQMFKNIRYLYKLLGTTDISSIGNGTVTGGLSSLNDSLTEKVGTSKSGQYHDITTFTYSVDSDGSVFSAYDNVDKVWRYLPRTYKTEGLKQVQTICWNTTASKLAVFDGTSWHYIG